MLILAKMSKLEHFHTCGQADTKHCSVVSVRGRHKDGGGKKEERGRVRKEYCRMGNIDVHTQGIFLPQFSSNYYNLLFGRHI
jgi:hypothetical protein